MVLFFLILLCGKIPVFINSFQLPIKAAITNIHIICVIHKLSIFRCADCYDITVISVFIRLVIFVLIYVQNKITIFSKFVHLQFFIRKQVFAIIYNLLNIRSYQLIYIIFSHSLFSPFHTENYLHLQYEMEKDFRKMKIFFDVFTNGAICNTEGYAGMLLRSTLKGTL